MRGSVDRRIRVLIVRRRLEDAAAGLLERATGTVPSHHSVVPSRLMLLTAGTEADEWSFSYGVACRAARVYGATSAALHSNRAFGDVPEHEVREWEQVVREFDDAMRSAAERRGVSRLDGTTTPP